MSIFTYFAKKNISNSIGEHKVLKLILLFFIVLISNIALFIFSQTQSQKYSDISFKIFWICFMFIILISLIFYLYKKSVHNNNIVFLTFSQQKKMNLALISSYTELYITAFSCILLLPLLILLKYDLWGGNFQENILMILNIISFSLLLLCTIWIFNYNLFVPVEFGLVSIYSMYFTLNIILLLLPNTSIYQFIIIKLVINLITSIIILIYMQIWKNQGRVMSVKKEVIKSRRSIIFLKGKYALITKESINYVVNYKHIYFIKVFALISMLITNYATNGNELSMVILLLIYHFFTNLYNLQIDYNYIIRLSNLSYFNLVLFTIIPTIISDLISFTFAITLYSILESNPLYLFLIPLHLTLNLILLTTKYIFGRSEKFKMVILNLVLFVTYFVLLVVFLSVMTFNVSSPVKLFILNIILMNITILLFTYFGKGEKI